MPTKLIHPTVGLYMAVQNLLQPVLVSVFAVLFSDYFCSIFTGLKGHETMVSVAILVIYGIMAYMGTYLFASINSLIVVVMMVAVAVYIVLGIPNIDASQLSIGAAFGSGIKISSIGAAVSVFASCLSGGTAVSQIADEVKNPRRDIPLALILAPVIVAFIYILMAVVTLGCMNGDTLQGRAVIVLTRKYGDTAPVTKVRYCDYSHSMRGEKERLLSSGMADILSRFEEYTIDADTVAFSPVKPFNTDMYKKFWPVSDENGQNAIFMKHCSGIKLAPTAIFTHVKAQMLKRRSREIAANGAEESMVWFSGQDRPPKEEKVNAFQNALNDCGDRRAMDQTLSDNIRPYSFRPFLTSNVLLWQDVLMKYSRIGGGGTRLRPEIIKAYSNQNTIGFAMAHAPKDLNPTLSQFVSFCWYYPDNDMCTRGNSHIYMNQYPNGQGGMKSNITPKVIDAVLSMTGMTESEAAKEIVFYVYAVMCSQVYLDDFEGALFTVNQSDKRARVPVVSDKDIFLKIAGIGRSIAELEKADFEPENILGFDYEALMQSIPSGFQLKNVTHPFDSDKEILLLTDGTKTIEVYCPLSLQRLNISGYDVIKAVWLKFNSYDFTHCEFAKNDMKRLLDFLNTIAMHEKYVEKLDEVIAPILEGLVPLVENEN